MSGKAFEFDVLILGGGVAGLWTACHLAQSGYACVLVERRALGYEQTLASQGIIHGGIKYALTGEAGRASRAIARMPELWRRCLVGGDAQGGGASASASETSESDAGKSDALIDLRAARVLSECQYLWTTPGVVSRIAGAAASKAIRTAVERVERADFPAAFVGAPRGVDLYRVGEPVLESQSVVVALAREARRRGVPLLVPAEGTSEPSVRVTGVGSGVRFECSVGGDSEARAGRSEAVLARALVLAAGSGNESLARDAGLIGPKERIMQCRPLHMVMARRVPAEVFGHCLGSSTTPRLTITTAPDGGHDGAGRNAASIWNIGGTIAETGVQRSSEEQIQAARTELRACLPWIDTASCELSVARWERAEGLTTDGSRPDEPVVRRLGSSGCALAAWPTKLAFAPELAARVSNALRESGLSAGGLLAGNGNSFGEREFCESGLWQQAGVAPSPWERAGAVWN